MLKNIKNLNIYKYIQTHILEKIKNIKLKNKKINYDLFFAIVVLAICLIIFIIDGINAIQHSVMEFDGRYNATVAANYFRYGKYMVLYPKNIIFYNLITTGPSVLIPTAFIYKMFGVNLLTTGIIPLIYGIMCFVVHFMLFNILLKEKNIKVKNIISALITICLLFTDKLFYYCSTNLIGESATLFFLLLCIMFLLIYDNKRKKLYLILSGFFLMAAFLTKTSMIFILCSMIGIMVVETFIMKKYNAKELMFFFLGIIISIIVLDSIKLIEIGSFSGYISWYKSEWGNMFAQSGGDEILKISEKLETFQELINPNKIITLIVIILPVCVYFIRLVKFIFMKKELKIQTSILYMGVAGSSLLIYYLLLGKSGLNYPRRLSVNTILIRIYFIYFMITIILLCTKYLKNKNKIKSILVYTILFMILFLVIFPITYIKETIKIYGNKQREKDYDLKLMEQFLEEIKALPENATIYTYEWFQEPNITLFLDRKMVDITTVDENTIIKENSYFVIGRLMLFKDVNLSMIEEKYGIKLEKINNIEVNHDLIEMFDMEDIYTISIIK